MRKRLFFMLPDIPSAHAMLEELLLARVEERHMRFYVKDKPLPQDMPAFGVLQRTDIIHGAELGLVIGAASGLLAGCLLFIFPPDNLTDFQSRFAVVLLSAFAGAVFGSWMSGRAAMDIPNSSLEPFQPAIDRGQVLLVVDLPYRKADAIKSLIASRHPEMQMSTPDIFVPIPS